jgi:lipopolysaccharide export system protein LptC
MAEAALSMTEPPTPAAPSLDLERRAAALAKWRKRSRQVQFFRKALPAAIAAILIFGVGWVAVRAVIALILSSDHDVATIHLLNPTFYGRNEKGQPYIMTASEAVQDGSDSDRIFLTNPGMKQYNGNPLPMTVRALHGVYYQQKKLLDMSGKVVATDGRGNVFHSEYAHVDMPNNSVVGNVHCWGEGPSGKMSADSYQVYDKGEHMIFTGHVYNRLVHAASSPGAAGPAAAPKTQLTPATPPPMQPSVVTPAPR